MKKLSLFLFLNLLLSISAIAQAPNKMSYQSVVRNASGAVVASGTVGIKLSLLQGSATGTASYVETHSVITDANGIASLEIGGGTPVTGTLAAINWAGGPYFIKTETDPADGISYSISGTSQLLSVPYALYSVNGLPAGTAVGNTLYWNGTSWVNNGNIFNNGGNVGIGTNTPAAKLDVLGDIKIKDGTEGAGKILTSDVNGLASWTTSRDGFGSIGNNNIAIGATVLSPGAGNGNTAIGQNVLSSNTIGDQNTAIGLSALSSNTTGGNNTALGVSALRFNNIGSYNTAIGEIAFLSGTNFSNSTAIGYNAQITASNMIRLGDANVTSINGAVAFTVVSDARFKKDIHENVLGLPFIMKLRPVTYHMDMESMAKWMKTPDHMRIKESESAKEKVLQTGFIAQEVEKAAQELGYAFSGIDKPSSEVDYYGLRYAEFTVPLVKAVQEQQKMIESMQVEIKQLKEQATTKQTATSKLEQENTLLKSAFEARLKKIEDMLNMKAKK
jgi:trimeric autotransporter adhesin